MLLGYAACLSKRSALPLCYAKNFLHLTVLMVATSGTAVVI